MATAGSDPSLNWKTIDSSPFQVHFYQGEEQLAAEFLALAHEAYKDLTEYFGFEPSEGIHIVVTDDTDSANGLATALPYNYIILYGYIPDAGGELGHWGAWRRILGYHELLHIFQLDRVTGLLRWLNYVVGKTYLPNSALPTWFIEGMAVVKESRINAGGRVGGPLFEMYLRLHALEGSLLRIDEASGGSLTLPRGTIPYLYGSYFLHWLSDLHGEDKLVAFVEEQAGKINPYSLNISARRLFGSTFVELYREWQKMETARARKVLADLEKEGLNEGRRIDFGGESAPMPSFTPDGSLIWRMATGHETQYLRRLAADGTVENLHHCRGGCDRPQLAADGNYYYSSFQYYRTYHYYQDLLRLGADDGKRVRLTEGARVKDPSVSPDGSTVAFVRTAAGRSKLVLRQLDSGDEKVVYDTAGGLSWPSWSPDGARLAFGIQERGYADIAIMDVAGAALRRLTEGPAVELQPVWTPDGKAVVFSSSISGIFDIYALAADGSCPRKLTNVVGGAFSPTVSPDGKRVVYSSFHIDGHHLYEVPLADGPCGSADFSAAPGHRAIPRPAPVDPAPFLKLERERYLALAHIAPRSWSPGVLLDNYKNSIVSFETSGADPVGKLAFSAMAITNLETENSAATLSFSISEWYPTIGLFAGYYQNQLLARVNDEYESYVEDDYFASCNVTLPFRATDHSFSFTSGYSYEHFRGAIEGDWQHDPGGLEPYTPVEGNLGTLSTGFTFDNTQSHAYSVVSEKGLRFSTDLRWSSPLVGSNWTEYHTRWRLTNYFGNPFIDHHVLRTQLRGGWSGGRDQFLKTFSVGGYPDRDIVSDLMNNVGVGGTFLRGYPPSAIRGKQYHYVAADYFLPIWRVRRGFETYSIFFQDLYLDVFGNGAGAFDTFAWSEFLWGAGAELRLETMIGFQPAIELVLGSAYGFQEPGGYSFYFMIGQ